MATAGTLTTILGLDARKFQSGLSNARKSVTSFASDVTRIVTGIQLSNVFDAAAAGLRSMVVSTVKLAADAETSRIQFEVLTGNAEKGAALFKDIEKFAGRTSFSLESAADATKNLLASGINESDVMKTMQMLGDLAMGDANKLGFLAKAYTDVMNKGKLQAQELRQFAENGVGLIEPLAKMFGKTAGEILEMSEAGEISFQDMQRALQSLTGEGGRFHGMMARVNQTFTGQWNSMIESAQTLGRELGAVVLPELTKMISATGETLQNFTAMPDKAKFLGEILESGFAVGVEHMKVKFDELMKYMLDAARKNALDIALLGSKDVGQIAKDAVADGLKFAKKNPGKTPLQVEQERFGKLWGQIAPGQGNNAQPFVGPLQENAGPKDIDFGGLFGGLKDKLEGPLAGLKMKGQGMFDRAKLDFDWWGGLAKNAFGMNGEDEKRGKPQPQAAGAMERGSAEAFSTIVANLMGSGKKDPAVAAIEKQTKDLVKGLKPKAGEMPFQIVEAFL